MIAKTIFALNNLFRFYNVVSIVHNGILEKNSSLEQLVFY